MSEPQHAIPIVDFGAFSTGDLATRSRIAAELTTACRRVGFVYIRNHGIPAALLEEAFAWSQRLFDLPREKKMLAPHPPGPDVHRGYSWPGLEKVSQYIHTAGDGDDAEAQTVGEELRKIEDYKESYEIGSETFARQPNVWLPEEVLPGFRAFMTSFYWRCFETGKQLLRALSIGLDLDDEDLFLKFHSGENAQLRLLHYPPIETERLESNTVARMPAHSDWGTITMLFQDECGGLQVEDPKQPGHFIDAVPLEGALVMNVGDLLMRWSNDYFKSTLHRVTIPPETTSDVFDGKPRAMTRARYSIPYFVSPDSAAIIECLSKCAGEENPPRYEPIVQDDYQRMRAKTQYK
ncbi:hypothetical protein G7054_g3083 [Neopestalotiopsis clavispora]|nr:hypothetical protein G7054_g3083 [Neopestalotiopsis clavispora]